MDQIVTKKLTDAAIMGGEGSNETFRGEPKVLNGEERGGMGLVAAIAAQPGGINKRRRGWVDRRGGGDIGVNKSPTTINPLPD
jgi:hypothetical protein